MGRDNTVMAQELCQRFAAQLQPVRSGAGPGLPVHVLFLVNLFQ